MTLPPFGPDNEEAAPPFEPDVDGLVRDYSRPPWPEDGSQPKGWPGDVRDAEPRLRGVVRDIRAEAQSLSRDFVEIRQAAGRTDPQVQEAEVRAVIERARQRMVSDSLRIDKLLLYARDLLDRFGTLYDWTGDEITNIENAWQRVTVPEEVAAREKGFAPRLLAEIDASIQGLNDMILHCALVTVPTRLNGHLRSLRVGGALDFAATFADELPEKEHQQKLLAYLVAHPASVDGVVDVSNEMVYRAARTLGRRLVSFALVLGCGLIGLPLILVLTHLGSWFSLEDWPVPKERLSELLVAYLFLSVGSMLHLLVGTLKQSRDLAGRSSLVLGDLILWVHVREVSICLGMLALPLAITALAFSLDEVGWETAFFVGYSIDSFLGLFLDRFAMTASTRTSQLEKALA
jgi:hypothetical protein